MKSYECLKPIQLGAQLSNVLSSLSFFAFSSLFIFNFLISLTNIDNSQELHQKSQKRAIYLQPNANASLCMANSFQNYAPSLSSAAHNTTLQLVSYLSLSSHIDKLGRRLIQVGKCLCMYVCFVNSPVNILEYSLQRATYS